MIRGISVIMPSYLGEYIGSRKNPVQKIIRAVESFKKNVHSEKELIIVSDGCEITNEIYFKYWIKDPNIVLVRCEKRPHTWPGELREVGRALAKYEWVTYLDSDDVILEDHLSIISNNISNDIKILLSKSHLMPIIEEPSDYNLRLLRTDIEGYKNLKVIDSGIYGKIYRISVNVEKIHATWQLSHHNSISIKWKYLNGNSGEDTEFIKKIIDKYKYKIIDSNYLVCHMAHFGDRTKIIWEI